MRRVVLAALLAVPAGAILGLTGQGADRIDPRLAWAGALGVPWLAVAFAVGAVARERWAAVVAGAVALMTGTLCWYGVHALAVAAQQGGIEEPLQGIRTAARAGLPTAHIAAAWLPAAALSGAAFALAGAIYRTGAAPLARAAAVAALAGGLIGESVLLAAEWPSRAAQLILGAELAAGALLPFILVRRGLAAAVALTVIAAVVLGVAESEVRAALRDAGWRGP